MQSFIVTYDENMNKTSYINTAMNMQYEKGLNRLWYASFQLAKQDPKFDYCKPYNYIRMYDNDKSVGLYRIMPSTLVSNQSDIVTFECEHVISTLFDDVLFQYHQIGNLGVYTKDVIEYVLSNQSVKNWKLGKCDFKRQFEYKWENENLLAALFSIAEPFDVEYIWTVDTNKYPWIINLEKIDTDFKSEIRYRKNMLGITKAIDPRNLTTRLYGLGYGEGDNQLTIESVNQGKPYIEKNIDKYGVKESILVDRRFENPDTLKAYMESILSKASEPKISYSVSAIDLFQFDNKKYEEFKVGDYVRVVDEELGILVHLPIISLSKNITENTMDIEVGNESPDISGTMSELQNRARINETYAQGATNQMIIPFSDNADQDNPAKLRFYVPDTLVRINKCILNLQFEPFRGYTKSIESAESTTVTSEDGGGGTSEDGGDGLITSKGGGATVKPSGLATDVEFEEQWTKPGGEDGHQHPYNAVIHHKHEIDLPDHEHKVELKPHKHTLPEHTHKIKIDSHKHDIDFGIFNGPQASSFKLKIDGKEIDQEFGLNEDINIIPFLSVDGGGRIHRNTWHTVEVLPNSMTRVNANIFLQIFTNSRGGGDY